MERFSKDSKILIVGSGFSGIVQAILLDRVGFTNCTLVNTQSQFRAHQAPFVLAGTGRHILQEIIGLDVSGSLEAFPVPELQMRSVVSSRILTRYTIDWDARLHDSLLIRREDLLPLLVTKLNACSTTVLYNTTVKKISAQKETVSVETNTSTQNYDVVIDCSGFDSHIRTMVYGVNDWRTPRMLWLVSGQLPADIPRVATFFGKGVCCSQFRLDSASTLAFVTKMPLSQHQALLEGTEEQKRKILGAHLTKHNAHATLRMVVQDSDSIHALSEKEIVLPTAFEGRVVFVGDAEHGLTPFTGMGGSLAFEDAVVLADSLERSASSSGDLTVALREYDRIREPRIRYVRRIGRLVNTYAVNGLLLWPVCGEFILRIYPRRLLTKMARTLYRNDEVHTILELFMSRHPNK